MNAPAKIPPPENVYQRLNRAREMFHAAELRKSGRNTFANYSYFELGDFLVPALTIFNEVGLCALPISFTADEATMTIVRVDDPSDRITFTSPMGSAALKGCHEVQNIGAVETYQRRYLWVAALEIVEHDALDAGGTVEGQNGGRTASPNGSAANSQAIDDAQWAEIMQLIQATNADTKAFCTAYKIPSVRDLPASAFERARKQLNTKLTKMIEAEKEAL